jgi:hypothetical protein
VTNEAARIYILCWPTLPIIPLVDFLLTKQPSPKVRIMWDEKVENAKKSEMLTVIHQNSFIYRVGFTAITIQSVLPLI